MLYEPLICAVTITNLSGGTLSLADTPREKWFGFQIETVDGRPLPPIDPDYRNQPVEIEPGQRLTRLINLTPLYPLSEFGTYRVRAAIYPAQIGRYFVSPQLNVEITEGRQLWQQTVGIPGGAGEGKTRTFSILAHRLPRTTMLYLRVEDKEAGHYLLHDPTWAFHHVWESRHRDRRRKSNSHPSEHRAQGFSLFAL